MDPVTGTYLALSIAGAALGGYSSYRSQQAANAQFRSQAAAENLNAQIAAENAQLEVSRRQDRLRDSRRRYNMEKGSIRAQAGAMGIFGGSSLDLLLDQDTQGFLETQSIARESAGAQQNQYNQVAAAQTRARGAMAGQSSAAAPGIGSLLSGLGTVVGTSSQLSMKPPFVSNTWTP